MSQITDVTYFVALPFVFSDDGVAAGEATECLSANAAVMRAEVLSRKPDHAGAVAFSRTGNPLSGDFSDATLLRKFGDVPAISAHCETCKAGLDAQRDDAGARAHPRPGARDSDAPAGWDFDRFGGAAVGAHAGEDR